MKLIKIISIIVSTLLATASFADKTTATVQKDLNLLGYNAGPVDGSYGKKTRIALEQFYKDNGGVFDGKLDGNEIKDLKLKHKLNKDDIKSIVCNVPPGVYKLVSRPIIENLTTNYAKLCARFVGASYMINDHLNIDTFTNQKYLNNGTGSKFNISDYST